MAVQRLAGSPEVVEAMTRHFRSDGVPPTASLHLAAEVAAHPDAIDTNADRLKGLVTQLRQQGYADDAAQVLAVELLEKESARASM